jgi:acyl carrier protein
MEKDFTLVQITGRIKEFLLESYLFGYDENELSNDLSFLELGILDSTGIMELVTFVESEFNINVLDEDILPENLDSIECISRYVYSRLNITSDVAVGR